MRFMSWMLLLLAAGAHAAIPSSVTNAAVRWTDVKDTGIKAELASMPIGNGDVAGNVWVEGGTGDLLFYIAKSDAFDQNSQPIKVGRVRVSFEPPLLESFAQELNLAGGAVDITVDVVDPTKSVVLHANELLISSAAATVGEATHAAQVRRPLP